jgi:hypothetical protein
MTAAMTASKTKIASLILLGVTLLGGTGVSTFSANGLQLTAEMPRSQAESKPRSSQQREHQGPQQQRDTSVTVSGQILDPDGMPVRDTKVYYYLFRASSPPGPEAREVRATSSADGRFRFQMPPSDLDKLEQDTPWDKVMIVAVASGYGPAWTSFSTPEEAARLKLQLVKDDVPINCRILDLEGRPIPGITVRTQTIIDGQNGRLDLDVLPLLQKETRTDKEGRFKLTGFGRERNVALSLRGPTIAARERDLYVMTRIAKPSHVPINKQVPELGKIDYYGATSDIVAAPTKPIIGTVRDKDTGNPLAGVTIQSFMRSGNGRLVQDFLQTTSDQEGRYRLLGMPKGEGNEIRALAPSGKPYFTSLKRVNNTLGLDAVQVDFTLKRGVWIRGRVTDKVTGKPVRARVFYGAFLDNPHLRSVPGNHGSATAVTGADGSFAVLGLPGRGLLAVKADEDRFLPSIGADQIPAADKTTVSNFEFIQTAVQLFPSAEYHAFVQVNPTEDSKVSACDVRLDPGKSVQGTILAPDGKPLDGVKVMDLKLMWSMPKPLAGHRFTATALDPRNPRQLFFYHRGKHLGAAVVVRGDEEKRVVVHLQSCGSVTGRILDAKEHPQPDWTIYGRSESSYMSITTGRWWELYVSGRTDQKGRFRIDLIPGVKYNITVGGQNHPLTLKPRECKDLGDTRIE